MLVLHLEKYPVLIALESDDECLNVLQILSSVRCRLHDYLQQSDLTEVAKEWLEEKINFIEKIQHEMNRVNPDHSNEGVR